MQKPPLSITNESEQLQSKVISFLRFPLCVAVVMIHIVANTESCANTPIYDSVHYLFGDIFARVAVPLFFMFSGYLFFYKSEKFALDDYKRKLQKRIKTLCIPYLFWNLIMIIGCSFSNELTLTEWIKAFWIYSFPLPTEGIASMPIATQFWYIRDLMVTVLLSPIIYWLIKKWHIYFVIALATLWITNYWPLITGFNITALFFFSLGAYCSIFKINFAEKLKSHTKLLGSTYIITIIPILIMQDPNLNPLRRVGILLGMAFTISLSSRFISNGKWRINKFLSESSFFIFAYHIIALIIIRSVIVDKAFKTDIMCTVQYFVLSGVIVITGLLFYYLLKRFLPRFTSIITGGR